MNARACVMFCLVGCNTAPAPLVRFDEAQTQRTALPPPTAALGMQPPSAGAPASATMIEPPPAAASAPMQIREPARPVETTEPPPNAAASVPTQTHEPARSAKTSEPPPNAADCMRYVPPTDCAAGADDALPRELRCTGLYGDWPARELACGVREYTPAFELWSDGAQKRRFVSLPQGSQIDASDPDAFVYPVGTQFWKEFSLSAADGGKMLAETRLLRKTASGWLFTSYVWSRDGQSTQATYDGEPDLYGTGHTVPERSQCQQCHKGRIDFVLGWDMVLLGPGAIGTTRETLLQEGLLKNAPAAAMQAAVPGDEIERAALGYLHVNCGVACHNANRKAEAQDVGFQLRVEFNETTSVHSTDAVRTGVNQTPSPAALTFVAGSPFSAESYYDLRPLDPQRSLVPVRMNMRGLLRQMPPIATNRIDEAGLRTVTAWIEHMTTARGYAAPAP